MSVRGTPQRGGAECTFLSFISFAPSQGGVPECRSVELARPQFFAPSQGGVRECRSVEVSLSVGQRGGAEFFPPSQGGVPECQSVEFLSDVVLRARSLVFFPPSQGGVPECRSLELLSEVVLSARSLAFSHLRSAGPWNFSARWR